MDSAPRDVEKYHELRSTRMRPHAYAVLLGLSAYEAEPLMKAIHKGFPWKAFTRLVDNIGLSTDQIADALDLPLRTRARRKVEGRFHADESDRLLRLARIYARALDLFDGDRGEALRWLTQPKLALGGAVPLQLAKTDFGAREIEATIDRIEHGVYM